MLLNDPGRLLSVHMMHSALVAGWAGIMIFYELRILETRDPVSNPIWRQGSYVIPFLSRLGVMRSFYAWSLGIKLSMNLSWTYESMSLAHLFLSGFSLLAAFWHWASWDLNLFLSIPSLA